MFIRISYIIINTIELQSANIESISYQSVPIFFIRHEDQKWDKCITGINNY